MTPLPTAGLAVPDRELVALFVRLRWRVLRGALRSQGAQRWTVLIGIAAAVFVGITGAVSLAIAGHAAANRESLLVIAPTAIAGFVVAIGVIAGISQPIDPRVLATEPITDRQLAGGLLVGSAVGPPGLSGGLLAVGLLVGAVDGLASIPVVVLTTVSFMATLLLISRSTINVLGLFATRHPRAGQLLVGVVSLIVYGGFQFIPQLTRGLDENGQRDLAAALAFTPPGQLGTAMVSAADEPLVATLHLAAGSVWLLPLAFVFVWTTRRLIVAIPLVDETGAGRGPEAAGRRHRQPVRSLARRLCGRGAVGTVAWRGVLTRMRTPRSALETFTGAGVGMAIVLVPTLVRDEVGAGAVLIGGAVQLAVLFMAGNSFGSDGPALSNELLCGVDPDLLIRAKARSVVVVAAPIAVLGPVLAAAITGEWKFLAAGFLVGGGGLLAGAGGAIVQSTLVPIAIPEGDNPLAGGDSGKGCLAGLILACVVLALAAITLPVALGLLWAVDRGSILLVTLLAVVTVGTGWFVFELGVRYATRKWRRSEPEIYAAVIPSR
ncbi:MAG: hypothetical protein HKN44_07035 [Ilumatobacter sp.]|nr:hypothetical protein [Ilumatobacter sp.]